MTKDILLVTGLSGAGKSTVLKTLEDLGWEVVDNLPLVLLDRLLDAPLAAGAADDSQPLAIGIGARTRDFDPTRIVERIRSLRDWANRLIDTTDLTANALAQQVRTTFAGHGRDAPVLSIQSFGFARGLPRNADLVFDMRFLRNPHWDPVLRPGTGLDADVAAYVAADPAYPAAMAQIGGLLELLLPRYRAEGKSYVSVAIGCTGGRHRSVHVTELLADRLRKAGFSPTITHRDLGAAPQDSLEGPPASK